jgi:hypothetical protein
VTKRKGQKNGTIKTSFTLAVTQLPRTDQQQNDAENSLPLDHITSQLNPPHTSSQPISLKSI